MSNQKRLVKTSVGVCPHCQFDMDEYIDSNHIIIMCCNCEFTERYALQEDNPSVEYNAEPAPQPAESDAPRPLE